MLKQIRHHRFYLLSLFLIEVMSLLLILAVHDNKSLQMVFVIVAAGAYILWGIVHHKLHHNLYGKVILEYFLIAALGVTLVFFVLQ